MKRALIVDCFDSFTYNIYHILESILNGHCDVIRYNEFEVSDINAYSHLVLSPGPGLPEDYPKLQECLHSLSSEKSLLGVCLGMQSIWQSFGGKLDQLTSVKHGVSSRVKHDNSSLLFRDIPESFEVGHYHSWVVSEKYFPQGFKVTSQNEDGLIMSMEHQEKKIFGIQFHPESVMTEFGPRMLKNWIEST